MSPKEQNSNANVTYWLYDTQYISKQWNWCRASKHIVSFWDALGDYRKYKDQDSIANSLKKIFGQDKSYHEDALTIWNFAHTMKPGDIVFATEGSNTVVARGYVIGDYEYQKNTHSYQNQRCVKWEVTGEWIFNLPKIHSLLFNLNQLPETIAELENVIGNNKTGNSSDKWIVLIDKDVKSSQLLNIGDVLSLSLKPRYLYNSSFAS